MKVPNIEQDVLPSVQTSRALSLDIERRSEIPVAKGGVGVYQAVSQLADVATDIGNKMRDADTAEEYFKKRTDMLTQSRKIMTDIETDPKFKTYTNDQLFEIYNEKSNTMRDAIFNDMKWHNAKEKLSNDFAAEDTSNRASIQIAGYKNTIARGRADADVEGSLLASLGADTGLLSKYTGYYNDMMATKVAQGMFTTEEAAAKKLLFNDNMLLMHGNKYINENLKNKDNPLYKEAYSNLLNQMNELEKNGIVVSAEVKNKIVQEATSAFGTRYKNEVSELNAESTDVCTLYVVSLGTRNTNGPFTRKLEAFGDKNLIADHKRDWEIAQYKLAAMLAHEKTNYDNERLKSNQEQNRRTGTEIPGERDALLKDLKPYSENWLDINAKMDASIWAGKNINTMKTTSPEMDNAMLVKMENDLKTLAASNDPLQIRSYAIHLAELNSVNAKIKEKNTLIKDNFFKFATDPEWGNLRPVGTGPEAQEAFFTSVERLGTMVGLPRDKITYMMKEQAESDTNRLKGGDEASAMQLMAERRQMYGNRFPAIVRQYEDQLKGALPAYTAAKHFGIDGNNPDFPLLQTSLGLMGTNNTELKNEVTNLGKGISPKTIEDRVVERVSPYTDTFVSNKKRNAEMQAAKDIGLATVSRNKGTVDDAVEAADKMFSRNYNLRGGVRIHKQYNPDTVSDFMAESMLYAIPKFEFLRPDGKPMDKVDKEIIIRTGKYQALDDDSGIIFIRNTGEPVQVSTGAGPIPLYYRFKDIVEFRTPPEKESLDPMLEMVPEYNMTVPQMRGIEWQ